MYRCQLEEYKGPGSKFKCPSCGENRVFTRYVFTDTGEPINEEVGRCNRENNCGYHFTPKQFFEQYPDKKPSTASLPNKQELVAEVIIDFVGLDLVERSLAGFDTTSFAMYLRTLFGEVLAKKALLKYFVGKSKLDGGRANIFWRIDADQKVRTGKIMHYNPGTGKREKEKPPTWVHAFMKPFNHHLCFYGEHLITENPGKVVAIVESEKTAIIASVFKPDMVWIATGGASGCKWRDYSVYKVLQGRSVIMYPDYGIYNKSTGRTCFEEWSERAESIRSKISCSITVSNILEEALKGYERSNDYDLADVLLKRDEQTGCALTEENYPMMWDLNK